MKKTVFLRMLCLILVLCLLAGCRGAEAPEATTAVPGTTLPEGAAPTQAPSQPPASVEMSEEALALALANMDLSMLCAGFDTALRNEKLLHPERMQQAQVICTDYDGDGYRDILLGQNSHLSFSLAPQRAVDYRTEPLNPLGRLDPIICADKDGNIYKYDCVKEGFDIQLEDKPAVSTHIQEAYSRWQNGVWETVYAYNGETVVVYGTDEDGQVTTTLAQDNGTANILGKTGTYTEFNAHLAQIGMHKVSTRPCEYVVNTFDAAYWECLLEALDAYLKANYPQYRELLLQDIDGDGKEEAVFLVPGFVETWFNSLLDKGENYLKTAQRDFRWDFPEQYSPTGALVAELKDGKLVVTAHCSLEQIDFSADMKVRRENGKLLFDSHAVYQNGSFGDLSEDGIPQALESFMAQFGYSDFFCRKADLSALEGQEYVCVSAKDGQWYLFIFVIVKGNPVVLYTNTLQNSAMFLTEYEGIHALLTYQQSVYEQNGEFVTNYSFQVTRIDETGQEIILDSAYTNYSDSDLDATRITQFFQKPAAYLVKIVVIRDQYKLTGNLWMDPTDTLYGEPPAEEPVTGEKPQLGFVQIQDPSSWLHLRVGPGITYDKVLMDPNDPDSFVRQALGSPLTVLESAEADDPANPVWLRIRIIYGDRVIEGWSSKTYIRLLEEE